MTKTATRISKKNTYPAYKDSGVECLDLMYELAAQESFIHEV